MTNREYSIDTATKFEFYLLALVFTILGLSVQTGSLNAHHYQYIFEIAAWLSFLISGLAGLSRMEWKPVIYSHAADLADDKELLGKLRDPRHTIISSDTQTPFSQDVIAKALVNVPLRIDNRKEYMTRLEKISKYKYNIHRWCFAAGLTLLILSRILTAL